MYLLHEVSTLPETEVGNKSIREAKLLLAGYAVKRAVVLTSDEVLEIKMTGVVSPSLLSQILAHVYFGEHGVAVRSTAEGEDGKFAWPGQFKSRLYVSADSLTDVIIECAEAGNSDSVVSYSKFHGTKSLRLALMVQEMVHASYSGVLFTHDPLTLDQTIMVIEATSGVAEPLVSGQVSPSRYYIHIPSQTILPSENVGDDSLPLTVLKHLIEKGLEIKELFGGGQDIEWAVEEGTGIVYFNQARDITTDQQSSPSSRAISAVSGQLLSDGFKLRDLGCKRPDVLSDQNVVEILGQHPSPMAFGLFNFCFADGEGAIKVGRNKMGYEIGAELETGLFRLVAGQPRCSIAHDALTYRIAGIPISEYSRLVDYYLQRIAGDSNLANYPEVGLYQQNPSQKFLAEIFGVRSALGYREVYDNFFSGIRQMEDSFATLCLDQLLPNWTTHLDSLKSGINSDNPKDLSFRFRAVCDLLRTDACVTFVQAARLGFFAFTRLRTLLSELFGSEGEGYITLLSKDSNSSENPNLQFTRDLRALGMGQLDLRMVLEQYGHLASCELDIATPRYSEQPELLLRLSQQIASSPEAHDRQFEASALRESLVKKAGSKGGELDREVQMAQKYLALRETVKFNYLQGYQLLRQILLAYSGQLALDPGDMFFLTPTEMFDAQKDGFWIQAVAEERKTILGEQLSLPVPPVLSTTQLSRVGRVEILQSSNTLFGIGVTNFVAEGYVVVLESVTDKRVAELKPGRILVAKKTDPAWSPLLVIVGETGGLVTEVGGMLAHGAIYSREMGLAAVLNVANATEILQTGMKVRVNGPAGVVEVLQ